MNPITYLNKLYNQTGGLTIKASIVLGVLFIVISVIMNHVFIQSIIVTYVLWLFLCLAYAMFSNVKGVFWVVFLPFFTKTIVGVLTKMFYPDNYYDK